MMDRLRQHFFTSTMNIFRFSVKFLTQKVLSFEYSRDVCIHEMSVLERYLCSLCTWDMSLCLRGFGKMSLCLRGVCIIQRRSLCVWEIVREYLCVLDFCCTKVVCFNRGVCKRDICVRARCQYHGYMLVFGGLIIYVE
jgi:hypothetical protein